MSARIDARRNGDFQLSFGPNLALTATLRTGTPHNLAAPAALRTATPNLQEALLIDHFAPAVAHGARHQAIYLFRATALAARADIHARHLNLHAQPANGVFERHLQVVPQILATLRPVASSARATPSRAAKQVPKPEQIAQNIAEIGERGWIEALRSHALQPLMAIAVIGGAFLRIAQDAVRLGGFLESLFGILIVRIAVRVILERQFPVSALQARVITVAADTQDFVVVALGCVHFFVTATFTMAGRNSRPRKL